MLVLASLFWGSTFVLMKNVIQTLPAYHLMFFRFVIAFAFVPFFLKGKFKLLKKSLLAGLLTGFFLFWAFGLQVIALRYTSAANGAFITGLHFVFTPLLGFFLFKVKVKRKVLLAVVIAFIGFVLLSYRPGLVALNLGDIITVISAFCVALQILVLDYFLRKGHDSSVLFSYQVLMVVIMSLICIYIFEGSLSFSYFKSSSVLYSVLFMGIFCSGYAFWAQSVAQKHISPVKASLIFIIEPLAGSILDFCITGIDSALQIVGGALIMFSLYIAEVKKDKKTC